MPNAIVWHGSLVSRPHVVELTPPSATKIARMRSPSMPSQLRSAYAGSGSSDSDGLHCGTQTYDSSPSTSTPTTPTQPYPSGQSRGHTCEHTPDVVSASTQM